MCAIRQQGDRARGKALLRIVLAAAILTGGGLMAFAARPGAAPSEIPDLSGDWMVVMTQRGDCGDLKDSNGNPRELCSVPVSKLPMNPRTRAWLNFFDEPLSPKYDCTAASLPNILADPQVWRVDQQTSRVIIRYGKDNVVRTIWMDGRKHPPATEVFWHGHSIGRYEGNELVVETTNFTFDPDGIDDMAHIPSSARKRLIERYSRTGPDGLKVIISIEDPLFLAGPFTYTLNYNRSLQAVEQFEECDPEAGRDPLKYFRSKYPDR